MVIPMRAARSGFGGAGFGRAGFPMLPFGGAPLAPGGAAPFGGPPGGLPFGLGGPLGMLGIGGKGKGRGLGRGGRLGGDDDLKKAIIQVPGNSGPGNARDGRLAVQAAPQPAQVQVAPAVAETAARPRLSQEETAQIALAERLLQPAQAVPAQPLPGVGATPVGIAPNSGALSGMPAMIIDNQVLQSLRNGDTAGFINSLSGNVQSSLNNSANLFFQITA